LLAADRARKIILEHLPQEIASSSGQSKSSGEVRTYYFSLLRMLPSDINGVQRIVPAWQEREELARQANRDGYIGDVPARVHVNHQKEVRLNIHST